VREVYPAIFPKVHELKGTQHRSLSSADWQSMWPGKDSRGANPADCGSHDVGPAPVTCHLRTRQNRKGKLHLPPLPSRYILLEFRPSHLEKPLFSTERCRSEERLLWSPTGIESPLQTPSPSKSTHSLEAIAGAIGPPLGRQKRPRGESPLGAPRQNWSDQFPVRRPYVTTKRVSSNAPVLRSSVAR